MTDLDQLRDAMRAFTRDRDWERFHDPKSLVLALVGEVGELAAELQWLPADGASGLVSQEPRRTAVSDELADVLLYLVRLADVLGIDLRDAAEAKLARNAVKHPAR
jgi:NTP pyrophosphatase (non-canonical NTP hydrolase)